MKQKMDLLDAMVYYATREQPANWAVTADGGGVNDLDTVVNTFCSVIGIDPAILPAKDRLEWSRVLDKIATKWGVTSQVIAYVIQMKEHSEVHWRLWKNPHQAQDDICFLLGQHLSPNGIRKKSNGKTNSGKSQSALDEWRSEIGHTIEGEVVHRQIANREVELL